MRKISKLIIVSLFAILSMSFFVACDWNNKAEKTIFDNGAIVGSQQQEMNPPLTPAKYAAPKNLLLDFDSKLLLWESDAKESFYDISINGVIHYGVAGSPYFPLWDLRDSQTYYIKVRIKGNGYSHVDSDWSDIFMYTPQIVQYGRQLFSPVNLRIETNSAGENILRWDAVRNATWYKICFNGNAFNLVTATEFSLWEWKRDWPELVLSMKVKALGDGNLFSDSEWSKEISQASDGDEYKLWGMAVNYDVTQGAGSIYSNAESGFYTIMAGFDLTKCRIKITKEQLILKYYSNYANSQSGLTIEFIFEYEESNDSYRYFTYSGYVVKYNGKDAKDAKGLENTIQATINDANHLDKVLSSGTSTIQAAPSQRYFSCNMFIIDGKDNLMFFAELFGIAVY